MARSKQFDPDEALNKAMQVFRHKGYSATSMQDLVEAMGIGRGSMYETFGGKQALFNVAMAVLNPGDEAITHAPGWPTIVDQIKLADGIPVIVRTHSEDRFAVRADAVLAAVTPKTRLIVINSPGNPTGGLIAEDELRAVARGVAVGEPWLGTGAVPGGASPRRAHHRLPAYRGRPASDQLQHRLEP